MSLATALSIPLLKCRQLVYHSAFLGKGKEKNSLEVKTRGVPRSRNTSTTNSAPASNGMAALDIPAKYQAHRALLHIWFRSSTQRRTKKQDTPVRCAGKDTNSLYVARERTHCGVKFKNYRTKEFYVGAFKPACHCASNPVPSAATSLVSHSLF